MKCTCSWLALMVAIACGAAPNACPQVDLAERLRQADREVAYGTVNYRRVSKRLQPLRPVPGVTANDAAIAASQDCTQVLVYDDTGCFRLQTTGEHGRQPGGYTRVHDGRNSLTVSPNLLFIGPPTTPEELTPAFSLIGMVPRPCFPMGRGLSRLEGLTSARHGPDWAVEGRAEDGTIIRAVVDPRHGFIAKSILRLEPGQPEGVIGRWSFGAPVRAPGGVWLPSLATYRFSLRDGTPQGEDRYILASVDLHRPDPGEFVVPLEGKRIIDQRYLTPIDYLKLPPGVHDLDELRAYTAREVELRARIHRSLDQQRRRRELIRRLVGALLVVSSTAFIWLLYRTRRGEKA